MGELEWLRQNLIAPGLLPGRRLEAWLEGWSPERPLLRHLVERGVLDAGGAGTLSAAIKGYLRIEPAVLVGLFQGGVEEVPKDRSAGDVPKDRSAVDVPKEKSSGDVPKDRSAVDVPKEKSSGDVPKDKSSVDVPKDRSSGDVPKDRSARGGAQAERGSGASSSSSSSSQVRAAVDAALSGTWGAPAGRGTQTRRAGDMSEVIAEGLNGVLAAAQAWTGGLSLRPRPLPFELQSLTGELRGAPLRMTTRREQGGPFAALSCATICGADGAPCCVTLIGLPAAGTPGPVLGVDLIGLGGALSLVAVDLAPIDRPHWELRAAGPLADLHAALGDRVVARRWPEFAEEVFSPRAVIVGVRRGEEAEVLAAVAGFVARLPAVYAPGPALGAARAEAADLRVQAWRRAELRNRREHDALTRMFGAEAAGAFLAALFGD